MRKRSRRRAAWLVVIPLAYLVWICFRVPLYFGAWNWWTIARADSVRLYRVNPFKDRTQSLPIEQRAVAGPLEPERDWTRRVIALIGDSRNYEWSTAKACAMSPGVILRFTRGASNVDVAFCFECDMLSIGQEMGPRRAEDFDRMRGDLAALMREALPKDPVIQSLTLHHWMRDEREKRR